LRQGAIDIDQSPIGRTPRSNPANPYRRSTSAIGSTNFESVAGKPGRFVQRVLADAAKHAAATVD
jgi:hypothetical protein